MKATGASWSSSVSLRKRPPTTVNWARATELAVSPATTTSVIEWLPALSVVPIWRWTSAATVAAEVQRQIGTTLKAGNHSMTDVVVAGDTANSVALAQFTVVGGRFLSETDEDHDAPVAFIGADLANKLYPGTNPIGQQLNIDGHNFLVIGQASVL